MEHVEPQKPISNKQKERLNLDREKILELQAEYKNLEDELNALDRAHSLAKDFILRGRNFNFPSKEEEKVKFREEMTALYERKHKILKRQQEIELVFGF